MKLNSFDKVKQLTEEMVAIPSINKEPGGESAVARYIQDFYMSLPYFQAHPEQVKCFQTKNDFVVRHSTLAYVKGTKGNSNRTVILIGHIDTVGVDDFGTIREYAFRCDELPAKLRETFVQVARREVVRNDQHIDVGVTGGVSPCHRTEEPRSSNIAPAGESSPEPTNEFAAKSGERQERSRGEVASV